MINLFRKKNESSKIIVNIKGDELLINDKVIQLPINWEVLKQHFGIPNETNGNAIFWKDLGISTNPHGNGVTNHLAFHTDYNPMESRSKSDQKPFFDGKIIIDGLTLNKSRFDNFIMRKYEVKHFTYTGKKRPCLISISYSQTYDKAYSKPPLPKDKYILKKQEEEPIAFSDFGFKLAVIQELMYHKDVLKPKFDLYEFIECYDKRKIDIEEEGYDPIPEVTQYFKDLPIPKRLAKEITEIYQDGGNDIYLQLLRFGEGWEEYWYIESTEDVKNFPNLKKVTLCYAKNHILKELKAIGIQTE